MKNSSLSMLLLMLLGYCSGINAQKSAIFSDNITSTTLGVHVGTQGFGLNVAYAVSEKFALRLSGSYAPYGFSQVRTWSDHKYNLNMKADMGNVLLQAEVRPFNADGHGRFLRKLAITAGGAYFYKSEATAKGVPASSYTVGEVVVDKEDLGSVNMKATWKPFAPYAGLALREMKVATALSLNVDLGTHYLSKPKVTLTGDKLLAGNEANEATINRNMKDYRWLPVLQVGLSYHF